MLFSYDGTFSVPSISPKVFLEDTAFDSIEIYKYLLRETSFEKAYIPLKTKLKIEGIDYHKTRASIVKEYVIGSICLASGYCN